MKIVEPYVRILDLPDREAGIALLRKIEYFARISHRSEEAQTEDSWERFLTSVVLNHGDWSVVEHASVSVLFLNDRGAGEEQVRHRLASPTKESTRFVNYLKKGDIPVVYPLNNEPHDPDWVAGMLAMEELYFTLIGKGWKPEDARSVLPLALASKTAFTMNLRNWRYVLLMRTTKEAHHQLRDIMTILLEEFQKKIPLLFDDIQPAVTQRENLKKPR